MHYEHWYKYYNTTKNNTEVKRNKPLVVGISGGSACGKSSVAEIILQLSGLETCAKLTMDSYYKNIPSEFTNLSEYNFDHPNAFDFDLLTTHINNLLSGKEILVPVYDFTSNKRESHCEIVKPCNLIIVEGILVLYDKRITKMLDIKVFIDTDADIRLCRRIHRDIQERKRTLETVIERYHKFVKPAYLEFIKPTMRQADIVIPIGAENTVAVNLLAHYINKNLFKEFTGNLLNKKFDFNYIISPNDIIDPRYQFFCEKINVPEDASVIYKLKTIFEDFINGVKVVYYPMFLDILISNLLNTFNSNKKKLDQNLSLENMLIISSSEDVESFNREKFCNSNINIIYFKPCFLSEDALDIFEKLKDVYSGVNTNHTITIDILTLFLSPKLADQTINSFFNYHDNITFTTIYFSDNLLKYQRYIEAGGTYNLQIYEQEDTKALQMKPSDVFITENIIKEFKKLHYNYYKKQN